MTDTDSWSLRKGTTHIQVEYGHTHARLFATDLQMQKGPPVTISLDLGKNLRTRSKGTGTYVDAKSLAEGEIKKLKWLELHDGHVLNGLNYHLQYTDDQSTPWRLLIHLRGQHEFAVEPEFHEPDHLILRVMSAEGGCLDQA